MPKKMINMINLVNLMMKMMKMMNKKAAMYGIRYTLYVYRDPWISLPLDAWTYRELWTYRGPWTS